MKKLDIKKEFKELYDPSSKEVVIVDIPEFNFLMIDGVGDPATSQHYKEAMEALFAISYTLKFIVKKSSIAVDYGVLPLEGLWWADEMNSFALGNRDAWKWTSLIMQPHYITEGLFEEALEQTRKKKNLPALNQMRFESYHEGLSAQIMHLGPYSAEKSTIERIHSFIQKNGYVFNGKHHEIYLSDPRRSDPEKMKTILRQPVKQRSLNEEGSPIIGPV